MATQRRKDVSTNTEKTETDEAGQVEFKFKVHDDLPELISMILIYESVMISIMTFYPGFHIQNQFHAMIKDVTIVMVTIFLLKSQGLPEVATVVERMIAVCWTKAPWVCHLLAAIILSLVIAVISEGTITMGIAVSLGIFIVIKFLKKQPHPFMGNIPFALGAAAAVTIARHVDVFGFVWVPAVLIIIPGLLYCLRGLWLHITALLTYIAALIVREYVLHSHLDSNISLHAMSSRFTIHTSDTFTFVFIFLVVPSLVMQNVKTKVAKMFASFLPIVFNLKLLVDLVTWALKSFDFRPLLVVCAPWGLDALGWINTEMPRSRVPTVIIPALTLAVGLGPSLAVPAMVMVIAFFIVVAVLVERKITQVMTENILLILIVPLQVLQRISEFQLDMLVVIIVVVVLLVVLHWEFGQEKTLKLVKEKVIPFLALVSIISPSKAKINNIFSVYTQVPISIVNTAMNVLLMKPGNRVIYVPTFATTFIIPFILRNVMCKPPVQYVYAATIIVALSSTLVVLLQSCHKVKATFITVLVLLPIIVITLARLDAYKHYEYSFLGNLLIFIVGICLAYTPHVEYILQRILDSPRKLSFVAILSFWFAYIKRLYLAFFLLPGPCDSSQCESRFECLMKAIKGYERLSYWFDPDYPKYNSREWECVVFGISLFLVLLSNIPIFQRIFSSLISFCTVRIEAAKHRLMALS